MLQQVGPCLASVGNLMDDIVLSKCYFEILHFSYVTKLCNKATCALATEAVSSLSSHMWLEDYLIALFHIYNLLLFNKILLSFLLKKKKV